MATKAELEAELAKYKQASPASTAVTLGGENPAELAEKAVDPWVALSEPFDPSTVRKNPRGYHYISIDEVYNRLDDVLGPNWTLTVLSVGLSPVDPEWKKYGSRDPKAGFLASVTVRISALIAGNIHTVRDGVGADFADDPDKAIKTALANAVKKAANGFGVGRYLWKDEERAAIDEANQARNDVRELKKQVVALFKEQTGVTDATWDAQAPSARQELLADHFEVEVTDLASAETLNKILEGA